MVMTHEPQPQLHPERRRVSACHRHPAEPATGICACCLRERLSRFDPAVGVGGGGTSALSTGFKNSGDGGKRDEGSSASFPAELLRRSKSLSAGKCEGFVEPRRRSCDVRVRHTLWYLFSLDDERNGMDGEIRVETRELGYPEGIAGTVFESREEYENEEESRVSEGGLALEGNERVDEIEEEEDAKTMKEHIDLEWQSMKRNGRDFKDIAGSFWVSASVFSKKLRKWQQRQKARKLRKNGGGGSLGQMQVGKPIGIGRQLRDTQSEVGDYGFGRRSCDTDPRVSVDAGRMSLDGPRHSFDEPRASWDGHFIGRSIPRHPPKLAVVGNGTCPIQGLDNHVRAEEQMNSVKEIQQVPGGNFDRSSSERKMPALEVDEVKSSSNSTMSPAAIDLFHRTKSSNLGGGSSDSNSNSMQYDCSEGFESASIDSSSIVNSCNGKQFKFKNSLKWRNPWKTWSSARRHSDSKCGDEEMCCYRGNAVDDVEVESSVKVGKNFNREAGGAVNGVLIRSRSCISSRNSCEKPEPFHSTVGGGHEIRGTGKKRRESIPERNQIPRHSPTNHENGLLRFYLTPLRSYRRSRSQKHRRKGGSRSILRSILRLN